MFHLHRGTVNHKARTDVFNQLASLKTIRFQGIAGINDIDNLVGEPENRSKLHRTVELDDIGLPPLGRVIAPCQIYELGRHTQTALWRFAVFLPGRHQPTPGNIQVQWLIQPLTAVLHQHILTGYPQIRPTVLHIGGHVGGPKDQNPYVRVRGGKHQFPGLLNIVDQLDTRFF